MLKKTIKYVTFDGNKVEEDFYFNYTTPELTRMTAAFGMEIKDYAQKIADEQDPAKMIEFIERLVLGAYGVKSEDGKAFVKSKEDRHYFEYSLAYAELFEELLTVEGAAAAFSEGLVNKKTNAEPVNNPKQAAVREIIESHQAAQVETTVMPLPPKYDPQTGELIQ